MEERDRGTKPPLGPVPVKIVLELWLQSEHIVESHHVDDGAAARLIAQLAERGHAVIPTRGWVGRENVPPIPAISGIPYGVFELASRLWGRSMARNALDLAWELWNEGVRVENAADALFPGQKIESPTLKGAMASFQRIWEVEAALERRLVSAEEHYTDLIEAFALFVRHGDQLNRLERDICRVGDSARGDYDALDRRVTGAERLALRADEGLESIYTQLSAARKLAPVWSTVWERVERALDRIYGPKQVHDAVNATADRRPPDYEIVDDGRRHGGGDRRKEYLPTHYARRKTEHLERRVGINTGGRRSLPTRRLTQRRAGPPYRSGNPFDPSGIERRINVRGGRRRGKEGRREHDEGGGSQR